MGVTKGGGGLYSWVFPLSFQKVIVGYDKNGLGMVLKYQQDTSVEGGGGGTIFVGVPP